jgi:hypothetical protein
VSSSISAVARWLRLKFALGFKALGSHLADPLDEGSSLESLHLIDGVQVSGHDAALVSA